MMSIEKAEKADADEILRVQYAAYQSEAELYNNYSIQPLTQTAEQIIEEFNNGVVLKAVKNGRIIGSVRAYEKENTVYIGKLIVLPEYQNQGIGKSLLRAIEDEFHGKRYELFTGEKSEKNLKLYEKCGYTRFKKEKIAPELVYVYLEKRTRCPWSVAWASCKDEDFESAIDVCMERIKTFNPEVYGYKYAPELAPRMQLLPQGWRGYIEMTPIVSMT